MELSWLETLAMQYAPLLSSGWGLVVGLLLLVVLGLVTLRGGGDAGSLRRQGRPGAEVTSSADGIIEDREGYVLGTRREANIWEDPDERKEPSSLTRDEGTEGDAAADDDDGEDQEDGKKKEAKFVPYDPIPVATPDEMVRRSREFYELMNRRRTVRVFSDRLVPREVVENIILTAGTAPSGAHTEPWTFIAVSDASLKAEIRHIVELEEKINYERRMGDRWVSDLRQLDTSWHKPFLETAPYLILVFVQVYGVKRRKDGRRQQHYYHQISVALSTGLLVAAIHNAGLVTVTSTPMNAGVRFQSLLDRPSNEKFVMLLPIGFPADGVSVPDLHRKPLDRILVWK